MSEPGRITLCSGALKVKEGSSLKPMHTRRFGTRAHACLRKMKQQCCQSNMPQKISGGNKTSEWFTNKRPRLCFCPSPICWINLSPNPWLCPCVLAEVWVCESVCVCRTKEVLPDDRRGACCFLLGMLLQDFPLDFSCRDQNKFRKSLRGNQSQERFLFSSADYRLI